MMWLQTYVLQTINDWSQSFLCWKRKPLIQWWVYLTETHEHHGPDMLSLPTELIHLQTSEKTRIHSSRMRTARFSGRLREVVVVVCVCLGGVSKHAMGRRVSAWGVSARGCGSVHRGGVRPCSLHAGIHTPHVNRITGRCKNITFLQLRLRAVIQCPRVSNVW